MKRWDKENLPNNKIGRGINVIQTNCLVFATDLALMANNIEEIKNQIKCLEKIAGKIGLKSFYEKTEIIAMDALYIK